MQRRTDTMAGRRDSHFSRHRDIAGSSLAEMPFFNRRRADCIGDLAAWKRRETPEITDTFHPQYHIVYSIYIHKNAFSSNMCISRENWKESCFVARNSFPAEKYAQIHSARRNLSGREKYLSL